MKKTQSKTKQQCKLCCEPVTNKTGLQCRGACQRWMHFKCLKFTPGKIQDIKKGIIQVNCPCPNCKTTVPREILVDVPLNCEDKSCPAALPPICDQQQCPSRFVSQDIKAPAPPLTPKPITTIRGCDAAPPCDRSLSDLPPEPPPVKETCGEKCPPANTPSKPKPDSKCKPKAQEKPKTEPVKCTCNKCHAGKPNFTEKADPCQQLQTDKTPPVEGTCGEEKSPPVCPSASEKKQPAPTFPPCMEPDEQPAPPSLCSNPDCIYKPAPATPPPLPKTSSSYPKCGPSVTGQDCGNVKKIKSDCKMSSQDSKNDEHILVNVLQNLCAVMAEFSQQVNNLVGNLIYIIEKG